MFNISFFLSSISLIRMFPFKIVALVKLVILSLVVRTDLFLSFLCFGRPTSLIFLPNSKNNCPYDLPCLSSGLNVT